MTPAEIVILTDLLAESRDALESVLASLPPYSAHADCPCDRCQRCRAFDPVHKGAVAFLQRLRRFLGEPKEEGVA